MNQLSLNLNLTPHRASPDLRIEEGLLYAFPCTKTGRYQIGELRKIEGGFATWIPIEKRGKNNDRQYCQRCPVAAIKNMEAGSFNPRIRNKYL